MKTRERKRRRKKSVRYFDYSLFAIMIFLMCFGLVMLYSISSYEALTEYGDSMYYFKRQALFSMLGIVAMVVMATWPKFEYHKLSKYAQLAYFGAMFLMLLVKFTPLGVEVNGAKRWLKIGIQFQPSEIMKIAVILFIPYLICKMGSKIHTKKGTLSVLGWGGLAAFGVFYLTDNLSTAIIVMGIACGILFVVHKKTKIFIYILGAGVTLLFVGSMFLGKVLESSGDFRLNRIIAWLRPEEFMDTITFQTVQGLYAIGSGGFFGKGLGNGVQKMVIPEVQNDMILAAICEELGVFGAIMVLMLFGLLLYRLLFIAQNAPDIYGSLVVTGIMAHIAIQVVLNIAVVTNSIPNTGITLPFISYGGTSTLFLMTELGIALGVSRTIKLEE